MWKRGPWSVCMNYTRVANLDVNLTSQDGIIKNANVFWRKCYQTRAITYMELQKNIRVIRTQDPMLKRPLSIYKSQAIWYKVGRPYEDRLRGHPHLISDFSGNFLPTYYPYPFSSLYKVYFRLVISDYHKPTHLSKNVDDPLMIYQASASYPYTWKIKHLRSSNICLAKTFIFLEKQSVSRRIFWLWIFAI